MKLCSFGKSRVIILELSNFLKKKIFKIKFIIIQNWRYTKVAAEKITQTVLKTAISGGNGLMKSLHHSYSLNDLSQNSLTDEHTPVSVKRTMSVNRRERSHQSPSSRSDIVKRRNTSSSRTSLKSTDSNTTKPRPMSSSKIGRCWFDCLRNWVKKW